MRETAEQYIKRLIGYLDGKDPVKVQAATARRIERLIRGVPRERLMRRPAPRKWSIAEILAHLAEGELVNGFRMRLIVGAPGTLVQAYNQDRWAETGKYSKRDPKKSLELFRTIRESNIAFYKSLSPAQRKLHGIHSERGKESVEDVFMLFASHDLDHMMQIEAILDNRRKSSRNPQEPRRQPRRQVH
ncbi:MAG: DinB family protein [Acidobacteriota bacterium]|nr:DinB family protein [Acidobacteriota bacterium]